MTHDNLESFFGVRERQKIVQVFISISGPGQMPGNENRLDLVHQIAKAPQMEFVNPGRAPYGNADRMERNRIIRGEVEEQFGGVRIGQKIFRMRFQPAATRPGGYHLRQMSKTETDSWSVRNSCHGIATR